MLVKHTRMRKGINMSIERSLLKLMKADEPAKRNNQKRKKFETWRKKQELENFGGRLQDEIRRRAAAEIHHSDWESPRTDVLLPLGHPRSKLFVKRKNSDTEDRTHNYAAYRYLNQIRNGQTMAAIHHQKGIKAVGQASHFQQGGRFQDEGGNETPHVFQGANFHQHPNWDYRPQRSYIIKHPMDIHTFLDDHTEDMVAHLPEEKMDGAHDILNKIRQEAPPALGSKENPYPPIENALLKLMKAPEYEYDLPYDELDAFSDADDFDVDDELDNKISPESHEWLDDREGNRAAYQANQRREKEARDAGFMSAEAMDRHDDEADYEDIVSSEAKSRRTYGAMQAAKPEMDTPVTREGVGAPDPASIANWDESDFEVEDLGYGQAGKPMQQKTGSERRAEEQAKLPKTGYAANKEKLKDIDFAIENALLKLMKAPLDPNRFNKPSAFNTQQNTPRTASEIADFTPGAPDTRVGFDVGAITDKIGRIAEGALTKPVEALGKPKEYEEPTEDAGPKSTGWEMPDTPSGTESASTDSVPSTDTKPFEFKPLPQGPNVSDATIAGENTQSLLSQEQSKPKVPDVKQPQSLLNTLEKLMKEGAPDKPVEKILPALAAIPAIAAKVGAATLTGAGKVAAGAARVGGMAGRSAARSMSDAPSGAPVKQPTANEEANAMQEDMEMSKAGWGAIAGKVAGSLAREAGKGAGEGAVNTVADRMQGKDKIENSLLKLMQ